MHNGVQMDFLENTRPKPGKKVIQTKVLGVITLLLSSAVPIFLLQSLWKGVLLESQQAQYFENGLFIIVALIAAILIALVLPGVILQIIAIAKVHNDPFLSMVLLWIAFALNVAVCAFILHFLFSWVKVEFISELRIYVILVVAPLYLVLIGLTAVMAFSLHKAAKKAQKSI